MTNIDDLIDNLKNEYIYQLNNTLSDSVVTNKENITLIIKQLEDLKLLKNDIDNKFNSIIEYLDFNNNKTINDLVDRKIQNNNDTILVNIDTTITHQKELDDIKQTLVNVQDNLNHKLSKNDLNQQINTQSILLNNWKIGIDNQDRLCFKKKINNEWKLKYLIQ